MVNGFLYSQVLRLTITISRCFILEGKDLVFKLWWFEGFWINAASLFFSVLIM